MGRYTLRPISDRTWLNQGRRIHSQFTASWADTQDMLLAEIAHLKGRDIVLEMDVTEADLKINGELRANAKPTSGAVGVAFDATEHGPLFYRCDRFTTSYGYQGPAWQHNVRAIALTLSALRAVDRYGATETGQQYTGFKALPAGRAMPASHMTSDEAWNVLWTAVGANNIGHVESVDLHHLVKRARRATHPDHNDGDQSRWDKVESAARVLGVMA